MNAAIALGAKTTAKKRPGERRTSFFRRIFVDTPEDSLKLRVVTLAASLWASFTIMFVGVDAIIPLGAMLALAAGHYVSYRRRRAGLVIISLAIGVFIVVLGIVMRLELVAAIRGDRVPMAFFLLATGAASSFDLRTRAGLYTQLIFSGIVMFFAGELAFSNDFALLMAVYAVIVVGFFVVAFWEDEAREARTVRFDGPAAPMALGTTLLALLVALSLGAFMVLPWNSAQTPPSQRLTFVPFSGDDGAPPSVTPAQAQELLKNGGAFGPQSPATVGPDGLVQVGPAGGDAGAAAAGTGIGSQVTADDLAALARVGDPLDPGPDDARGLVMHVRSPVASYWRAAAYDTYSPSGIFVNTPADGDGAGLPSAGWYATFDDDLPYSSVTPRRRSANTQGERYLQTFFIATDVGGELLTGYDPISVSTPRDARLRPVIEKGATYQVVSRRPDASADSLRADRVEWQGTEFALLPPGLDQLQLLTQRLVADAPTDFDRAAAIASYLGQLEYAAEAPNQLVSIAPIEDFVFGRAPGTSIDFATAMTLMGRSAGLPTRLATGYLPGSYNPFSGANTVTQKDAHAWAEVAFEKAGWVPFDAAPRPDAGNTTGGGKSSGPLAGLLANRLGDSVASSVGGGIGGGLSGLIEFLTSGIVGVAAGLVWLAVMVAGWFAWRYWGGSSPRRSAALHYATIPGRDRAAVLDAFRKAEILIARAGFRVRRRSEGYAGFAMATRSFAAVPEDEMRRLAAHAERAAYSGAALDPEAPAQTTDLVARISAALAAVPTPSAEIGAATA